MGSGQFRLGSMFGRRLRGGRGFRFGRQEPDADGRQTPNTTTAIPSTTKIT